MCTISNKKGAILAASFGTACTDALKTTADALESDISAEFPDYEVRRAFTSDRIIKRLAAGCTADNTETAIKRLISDGFCTVICQPTYITHGAEYDRLCADLKKFSGMLDIKIGRPLLTERADCMKTARILADAYGSEKTCILMGHGTPHGENTMYSMMNECMRALGFANIHIGVLYGQPGLDEVLEKIGGGVDEITLAPFMFTAGGHARRDLTGSSSGAWGNILKSKGFRVTCDMTPLGAREEIRRLYISRITEMTK
jgi:sirohydrochlorin cobaltochelatase